jgi:hypothetical protein
MIKPKNNITLLLIFIGNKTNLKIFQERRTVRRIIVALIIE